MNPIPVVIDCDPGTDDAHALLLALASPALDVRAITTVAGNMPVDVTTENALKVVELAGVEVPVARGCFAPLCRAAVEPDDAFHGANGLGNATLPPPRRSVVPENAVETIRACAEACGGALHIIAHAPLTNLAILLRLHPEVKDKIAHLTVMGGARRGGNIAPEAEFNFFCDPEAAEIVMNSGIPTTLVDLTGCEQAGLRGSDAAAITAIPSRISAFLAETFRFSLNLSNSFGGDDFIIHDSITVASVIDPTLLTTEPCRVRVELREEAQYGKSIIEPCADGPIRISTGVDRDKFVAMCKAMMAQYPL